MSIDKPALTGHRARDPELRAASVGTHVLSFGALLAAGGAVLAAVGVRLLCKGSVPILGCYLMAAGVVQTALGVRARRVEGARDI